MGISAIIAGMVGEAAALTRSEQNTIRVFHQVSAGVVNITTTSIGRDFFFNPMPAEGSGSGVIVDKAGHIVTSYHVVNGSSLLEVTLADGSRWEATLVGSSPFGLGQTLTTGTISSLGRDVRISGDVIIHNVIQADAAINPGNSGGPLINSDGEVIGINTAIFSPTGSSVGISFAIPADTVRRILPGMVSIWPKLVSWALAVILVGVFLWWFWRKIQPRGL
ncbi:MAG: trypsin-like peptidase domain-containing protein [Deltaproteobacteria bacterium]|nr:trypsin-like peptidase domain-containing protein [Deltaproteobacteria bacterium]